MIIQIYDDDILNGEGLREVVFLQGCPHHCKGCFNPETWIPPKSNTNNEDYIHIENYLQKDYISGLTITGGDPLVYYNLNETLYLISIAKKYNKNIWIYTGYLWENLNEIQKNIINFVDVLCEGPFIEKLKSPEKPWVGSSNQRVIDVKESLKQNKIILWK